MAKRRQKSRTHKKVSEEELAKIPRSMVLRLGSSLRNHSLSQLVKDFRYMMQPHTAINLRERKANKLKDFIVMGGPLGVSELFVFNQSEETGNISLRVGKMPRGPMLQFKIHQYSLIKDVNKILKRPKSLDRSSSLFVNPPLLVMNGFLTKLNEAENHEKLLVTIFQNMFPPIQPQKIKVSSIRRVLMINKDPKTDQIDIRHYVIDTKFIEGTRSVRKLVNSHRDPHKPLPNLSKAQDMAELLLDPYTVGGMTSDSEVEDDAIVEVKEEQDTNVHKNKRAEPESKDETRKKAVKLTEIGPRITMSLVKIEEGLIGSSKTLYHSQISKSNKELSELDKKHNERKRLREERRLKQEATVKEKNAKKEAKKAKRKAAANNDAGSTAEPMSEDNSDASSGDESDAPEIDPNDYENDSDLYSDIEK